MKRTMCNLCCALALALPLTACNSMTHTVGSGGTGGNQVSHRTWYVLWGLIPVNEKDSKDLAAGATDYTVHAERDALDIILNIFTSFVSLVSRSETVTR